MTTLCIDNVISAETIKAINDEISSAETAFKEGKSTAGWHAKHVKSNEQLAATAAAGITTKVEQVLMAHPVFVSAARPKRLVKLLVSRYRPGMEYGLHVDDALMGGVRTDMSFTLFLADQNTYDGGELVIEGNDGDTTIKLDAGSLVLYPTTTLHRVAPVSRGERLAVVGWVRSFIRSTDQRETLFDLDIAIAASREGGGQRSTIDRLLKVRANLVRMWAED
jgi:PKHD-type hydroxylase